MAAGKQNRRIQHRDEAAASVNLGYRRLERLETAGAIRAFQRALRIDPELQAARYGLAEALRTRYLFYGLLVRGSLFWTRNIGKPLQAILVVGFIVTPVTLYWASEHMPVLTPILFPIIALCLLLALWSRLARPVVNILLLLDPAGREALPTQEKRILICNCLLLLIGALLLIFGNLLDSPGFVLFALSVGLLTIPLTMTLKSPAGWVQKTLLIFSVILILISVSTFGLWLRVASIGQSTRLLDTLVVIGLLAFFGGIPFSMMLNAVLQKVYGHKRKGDTY